MNYFPCRKRFHRCGIIRAIKVAPHAFRAFGGMNYAVFRVQQGMMDSAPTCVSADVGTNGFFTFINNSTFSGQWMRRPSQGCVR